MKCIERSLPASKEVGFSVKKVLYEIYTVFFPEKSQKDCVIPEKYVFDRQTFLKKFEKPVQNLEKLGLTGQRTNE